MNRRQRYIYWFCSLFPLIGFLSANAVNKDVAFATPASGTCINLATYSPFSQNTLDFCQSPDKVQLDKVRSGSRNKFIKYRKKFKRISSGSSAFKTPVRFVNPISFGTHYKPTYTDPHFLSHLHLFLFRLSPF